MRTRPEQTYPDHWEADVVLRDGSTARIRPITPDDAGRLVSFYEQVSDESKYYRFFAPYPRLTDRDVHRFTHHDYVDRVGLAVTVGGEIIATVRYDRIDGLGRPASAPAEEAEVAFLVQDAHQGRGVASALLEHIAAVARERGVRRFVAEVLPANTKMIKVFRDAGYTQRRSFEDGSVHLTLDLEPTEKSLAVQRGREQRAEARSVQRLLAPGSVAVIGTGRASGGMGRTVLRNILDSGYRGRLYAVNRAFGGGRTEVEGVPAFRSVAEIAAATGEAVDLAVVAVPVERVPEAVADCGEHGVRGLVVLTAGYAESGAEGRRRQRELVRRARSYGMRIIGPNSLGIISTADAVRLNASLAPGSPAPGRIGLFTQSGAIGIALLSELHRRGAGLSTFISSGNRADVSGNDFLQYWYDDPDTDVVLMYLESIGNPRKFTRLARRTAAVKPLVVVKGARHSGSEPPGHAVPATRIPDAAVGALLRQAGVIRVDTVTELIDVGLLLAGQPLPAGPRVAILGNSESLGLLTYDACLTEGLRPQPPLDLTTDATPADFRAALARALADDGCDAVVVTAIPWVGEHGATESGDGEVLARALRAAVAESGRTKPVAVVHVELRGLAEALAAVRGSTDDAPAPPGDGGLVGEVRRSGAPGASVSAPEARGSGLPSAAGRAPAPGGPVPSAPGARPSVPPGGGPAPSSDGSVPGADARSGGAAAPVSSARGDGGPVREVRSSGGGPGPLSGGSPRGGGEGVPVSGSSEGSVHGADARSTGDGGAVSVPGGGPVPPGASAARGDGGPVREVRSSAPSGGGSGLSSGGSVPEAGAGPGEWDGGGRIPGYPAAERAVRALSEAVRYARWRRQAAEPGRVPEFEDIDEVGAAALIERLLDEDGSGTLPAA
ncbi:GNAT family N-acetyltransferase, partial [Streptomyces clavuligerus]